MKYLKITTDIEELLDQIVSGVILHENTDLAKVTSVVDKYLSIVDIRELWGFHYVMYKFLNNYSKFKILNRIEYIKITQELFQRNISALTEELLLEEGFDADLFFDANGVSYDLGIPNQRVEAIDFTYSYLLQRFEELMTMKISTEDALPVMYNLQKVLHANYMKSVLKTSAEIMNTGIAIRSGTISGSEECAIFLAKSLQELKARFDKIQAEDSDGVTIASYTDAEVHKERNKTDKRKIFYSSIHPIGSRFAYAAHDIVAIVANEGVGKTTLTITEMYAAITQGCNCLIYTGETPKTEFQRKLEQIHIWRTYNIQVTEEQLIDNTKLKDSSKYTAEQIIEMINAASKDLWDNPKYGKVHFKKQMRYRYAEDDILKDMDIFEAKTGKAVDVICIDHTGVMSFEIADGDYRAKSSLSKNEAIDMLFIALDRILDKRSCMVFCASHTDNKTEEALTKGKEVGSRITANSAALSKFATHIYLLWTNDMLDKNDRRVLSVNKFRAQKKNISPMVLDRPSIVSCFYFDPKHQDLDEDRETSLEDLI